MTPDATRPIPRAAGLALGALLLLGPAAAAPARADTGAAPPPLDREAAVRRALEVEKRVTGAVEKVMPAVVTLTVRRTQRPLDPSGGDEGDRAPAQRDLVSGGSGVLISEDGFILTNDHVVNGAASIVAGLSDGTRYPARHVASDETGDIAIVKIDGGRSFPYAPLGDSAKLEVGQWVIALGNPFGLARDQRAAASLGIVSGLNRYQGGGKIYGAAIQTDAAINPGNSGGPLVDLAGRVVGINGRISIRGGERVNVGVGFAVPSNQIRGVLADLEQGRPVRHGRLGIRFFPDGEGPGIVVWQVDRKSAAERAGVRPQDVILEVDGVKLTHPVRLQNVISQLPAGRSVKLRVLRGGRQIEITAILEPRGASEEQP
jgi:S1-C subfamily serine protease